MTSKTRALNKNQTVQPVIDKANLRQVILDFPTQFEKGLELAKDIQLKGNFRSLEVSGMGGSSLPADILRTYLTDTYQHDPKHNKFVEVFQNRTYSLPQEAYDDALNIFASYSGTTEETLSSLKEAVTHKLPSVCMATGATLDEVCKNNDLPRVLLPAGIQPRYATGYFFAALYQILVNAGVIADRTKELLAEAKGLEADMAELEERGKSIAQKLIGKTPVIYAPEKFKALAMVWKIKINENAKTPAFWNFYPELDHNEMVGFTQPQAKFHVINLLYRKDHPQNIRRIHMTSALLEKKGVETTVVEMPDDHIFHTIFSTLILGDWVSYYLALGYGQDPTPVDMVEELKHLLA